MTFLAYELARQLPLDLARAPLYSRVAAGEVTRAVWRCDLVSGGAGGSGQGQHECGGGGAGRGCGRDHALGGQDRADRASGTALADDAGLPVGVGLDDRVAVALSGNPVMMSGCMTIHTPGDPAAEDRVAVQALAVPAGRARQVTEFLTAQAGQPGLAAGQRTSVEARVRYLRNNQEYGPRRGTRIRLADRRRDGGHSMAAASTIASTRPATISSPDRTGHHRRATPGAYR